MVYVLADDPVKQWTHEQRKRAPRSNFHSNCRGRYLEDTYAMPPRHDVHAKFYANYITAPIVVAHVFPAFANVETNNAISR